MRGLKCSCDLLVLLVITVALLVSAWIEIMLTDTTGETKNVALLVSAWIEIVLPSDISDSNMSHSS